VKEKGKETCVTGEIHDETVGTTPPLRTIKGTLKGLITVSEACGLEKSVDSGEQEASTDGTGEDTVQLAWCFPVTYRDW
jgi:hypothetical protein